MALHLQQERQQVHALIDLLSSVKLAAVRSLLEAMIDDDEDEELTDEDRRAIAASRDYFRQNPDGGISFEQLVSECDFTMDQIRHRKAD